MGTNVPINNFAAPYAVLTFIIGAIQSRKSRAFWLGSASLFVAVAVFYISPAFHNPYWTFGMIFDHWLWFIFAILLGYLFGVGGFNFAKNGKKLAGILLGIAQFFEPFYMIFNLVQSGEFAVQPPQVYIYLVIQIALGIVILAFILLKKRKHFAKKTDENLQKIEDKISRKTLIIAGIICLLIAIFGIVGGNIYSQIQLNKMMELTQNPRNNEMKND
jgi:hypothetical protein